MKKRDKRLITIKVKIAKSKKKVSIQIINTARLKHVSMMLCKLLKFDRFDTTITYEFPEFPHPINETTTLRQLSIRDGETIIATIERTNAPSRYETRTPFYKDQMVTKEVYGNHHFREDEMKVRKKQKKAQKAYLGLSGMKRLQTNNLYRKFISDIEEDNALIYKQAWGKNFFESKNERSSNFRYDRPHLSKTVKETNPSPWSTQSNLLSRDSITNIDKKLMNGLNIIGYYTYERKIDTVQVMKCVSLGFGEWTFGHLFNDIEVELEHLQPKKLRVVGFVLKDCSWRIRGFARSKKSGISNSVLSRHGWTAVRGIDYEVFFKAYDRLGWDDDAVFKVRHLVKDPGFDDEFIEY